MLAIRDMQQSGIVHITNYWLDSDPDFLTGMGVDLQKLPSKEQLSQRLAEQMKLPPRQKKAYAVIWLIDDEPVGHSNLNPIQYGKEAFMHLHIWKSGFRQKGMGTKLVRLSLPWFFDMSKKYQGRRRTIYAPPPKKMHKPLLSSSSFASKAKEVRYKSA